MLKFLCPSDSPSDDTVLPGVSPVFVLVGPWHQSEMGYGAGLPGLLEAAPLGSLL